ncbi:TPA: hypothetical protein HA251_06460 [Candidatus Woesearchaeota archaeon]|nr:hypothetical protein [Candidatus Woesearchaeota archaeon]
MKLTKVQSFMLYALGTTYDQFSERFNGRPLAIAMNKVDFIDLVHAAKIASKKDRAVYRNLESLEKLKLIAYDNKTLALTKKGIAAYQAIRKEMEPYFYIRDLLRSDDILKYTAKRQTVLKDE